MDEKSPLSPGKKSLSKGLKAIPKRVRKLRPLRRPQRQRAGGSQNEFSSPNGTKYSKTFLLRDFEVGKKLGIGKFGKVYLCREKKTGYVCAIKVLFIDRLRTFKVERTLRREIEIMANVRHPNIVRLFGYFYDKDRVYLIMEYASKGEVFDLLYDNGRFSERRAARYVKDLADALYYLHQKNIIHRDIKPENLLIDSQGRIKLADFGWSAHTKPGRKRRTMCGTTEYIPPELVKREPHDLNVDVWALGVLTYEFLYGKAPFTGKTRKDVFQKVESVDFTFPDSFSREAKSFISQLLQRDPEKRLKLADVPKHPFITKHCKHEEDNTEEP